MDDLMYRTWKDFTEQQYRKSNTFQLSIDELARDLYYDDSPDERDKETDELNFDG